MKPLRCGVYLRVSTDEQTPENQREACVQLAEARGFEPIVYEETGSSRKKRPIYDQLWADVRTGKLRAVCVWSLDRLERSLYRGLGSVLELDRLQCRVLSVQQHWLDLGSSARPLLVAVFAWVSEEEHRNIVDRTIAGLRRAQREGKRLGRPPASSILLGAAADRVERGASVRRAAKALGLKPSTLQRYLSARRRANKATGEKTGHPSETAQ